MRFGGIFDFDGRAVRLNEVDAALQAPDVWDDVERAQALGNGLVFGAQARVAAEEHAVARPAHE